MPLQTPSPTPIPRVVIDTNVLLDWLVFRNPGCDAFVQAVVGGRLQWLATPAMRDELAHVLGRGVAAAWKPDPGAIWRAWEQHAMEVPAVAACGTLSRFRCTDADDQKFIDLALGHPARWLLSRDRAVLRLARRARVAGLDIVTPEAWAALQAAP
jgi:predicted nucleic acid-binding protein